MDVAAWLSELGLEQYAPAFRDNDVDGEVLPELTADDLIGLGVNSIGHRRKLLAAIAALRAEPPADLLIAVDGASPLTLATRVRAAAGPIHYEVERAGRRLPVELLQQAAGHLTDRVRGNRMLRERRRVPAHSRVSALLITPPR